MQIASLATSARRAPPGLPVPSLVCDSFEKFLPRALAGCLGSPQEGFAGILASTPAWPALYLLTNQPGDGRHTQVLQCQKFIHREPCAWFMATQNPQTEVLALRRRRKRYLVDPRER